MNETILIKPIAYFDEPCLLVCDGKCGKAWGINSRPRVQLSGDTNDYEYLADGELGDAPIDPGTYEKLDCKPTRDCDRLNRWCARECERSKMVDGHLGVLAEVRLHDWNERLKNRSE